MFLYIVISPAPEDLQWSTEWVVAEQAGTANLIIKEFGKWGDHPHFNIISEVDVTQKSCKSWRERQLRIVRKTHPGLSGKWMSVREIYDLPKLLGGYLQKESNFELMHTDGKYDLDKFRISNRKFSTRHRWKFVPSFLEFPLFFLEYVEDVYWPYKDAMCGHDVDREYMPSLYTVCNHMAVNGIAVHHLFRRREDLEQICASIYKTGVFENTT